MYSMIERTSCTFLDETRDSFIALMKGVDMLAGDESCFVLLRDGIAMVGGHFNNVGLWCWCIPLRFEPHEDHEDVIHRNEWQ